MHTANSDSAKRLVVREVLMPSPQSTVEFNLPRPCDAHGDARIVADSPGRRRVRLHIDVD